MKNNVINWVQRVCGFVLLAALCLAISTFGVANIYTDLRDNPLESVTPTAEPIIREVLAWYYEDGTVEDEQGQLWYFEDATAEGQVWRLWINDSGTPADPTDDIVVDYTGG